LLTNNDDIGDNDDDTFDAKVEIDEAITLIVFVDNEDEVR
jgi:hypothetical protein